MIVYIKVKHSTLHILFPSLNNRKILGDIIFTYNYSLRTQLESITEEVIKLCQANKEQHKSLKGGGLV